MTSYPIFDADNHLYESTENLISYLPKANRRDIQLVQVAGHTRLAIKGRITNQVPNPTFSHVAPPGSYMQFYAGNNPEGKTMAEMAELVPVDPAYLEPEPRLKVLDQLGLQWAVIYPSAANVLEYALDGDPYLTHVAIHAVNEWLYDTWTFDYQGRLFATPTMTLPIVEEAVKELEWALDRGVRALLVRPAPATGTRGSRSFALPEFDPFWARVEEAGIPVCLHASYPPLQDYYETWEPKGSDNPFRPTPLKHLLLQHREIEDAIAAMICHGLFTRFPGLRVLSVENGADWVHNLLDQLESAYRKMPTSFDEPPLEAFGRCIFVNPFWEDSISALVDRVGADRILFGSDYPHPEGLDKPLEYLDTLHEAGISNADQQRIMSTNAAELFKVA